jgi:hypothetical protein
VFFQFRLKAEDANMKREAAGPMAAPEMKALVYRFGAYGTFLANFQDETTRTRYTELAWELAAIGEGAAAMPKPEFQRRFAAVDERFGKLNEDCVKAAQSRLL